LTERAAPTSPGFRWNVERDGSSVRLSLSGEVDVAVADEAAVRLKQQLAGVDGAVTVDLGQVTFMDSSGLRLLLDLRQTTFSMGIRLYLARLSLPVQRLLDVAGLSHWFEYVGGLAPKIAYCPICEGELRIEVTRCPYCGSVL
jgi:anti-anti-sigma factor